MIDPTNSDPLEMNASGLLRKLTGRRPAPRGRARPGSTTLHTDFWWSRFVVPVLGGLLAVGLGGCGKGGDGGGGGDGGAMAVPVVVSQVRLEAISERIFVVGSLAANERVEIKSEIDGRLETVGFIEGESVKAGQVLFKLDQVKLEAAVNLAEANFKLAKTVLERNESLLESRSISQQELDRAIATFSSTQASLELAKEDLIDATIVAPFDGVMSDRKVSPGQVVNSGTPLAAIIDTDPLKAEFNVPERFISQLTLGQNIEIKVTAYPNETFVGRVYFISPEVTSSSRTVLMKAEVDNRDGRLKAGMFGNLDLILDVKEGALVIPETAISYRGDLASVYVINEANEAELRSVRPGIRLAGRVEIVEGLQAGERVVTEGIQKIGPGSPVSISPKSDLILPADDPNAEDTVPNG
ncbi:MAG: efflux RND transporter periplasmic adaptor subunit [Opitutaceae bacterium]